MAPHPDLRKRTAQRQGGGDPADGRWCCGWGWDTWEAGRGLHSCGLRKEVLLEKGVNFGTEE